MSDGDPLESFRREYRRWLEIHIPRDWERQLQDKPAEVLPFQQWWMRELNSGGWSAPHWPVEYGGLAAALPQQLIIYEENKRASAPVPYLFSISLIHAAATLIEHGTDNQRQKHLPNILTGEELWCQGFSEPQAGSDLASLRTRADRQGDYFIVNGQKVWSSRAHIANWCLLLCRTDFDAPKHRGISLFLLDMRTPGVEVRPIRQITGDTEFSEIFLEDVRIPADNLIGPENAGWNVARTTLSTERGLAMLQYAQELHSHFLAFVDMVRNTNPDGENGLIHDQDLRQLLGRYFAETKILLALCEKSLSPHHEDGQTEIDFSSIVKLFYSELAQRFTGEVTDFVGLDAHAVQSASVRSVSSAPPDWLTLHLRSWALTISAGTNEIQRNLIAEQLLGLPREPRVGSQR